MEKKIKNYIIRHLFNFFPAYRSTGGRVIYISQNWQEVHVKLKLSWKTRNYYGTLYGGSLYGAIDPIYVIMLLQILGDEYIIWNKSSNINFLIPGNTTLYAYAKIKDSEIKSIKNELVYKPKIDKIYTINLVDSNGLVYAVTQQIINIRKKDK